MRPTEAESKARTARIDGFLRGGLSPKETAHAEGTTIWTVNRHMAQLGYRHYYLAPSEAAQMDYVRSKYTQL